MKDILSRCGYRCDLCLAYRPNVARQDEREYLRANWLAYFDLDIPVDRLICDGCLSPAGDATRIDASCPVRPCVIERGLEHCGQCEEFPCARLEQRRGHSLEQAREAAGTAFSSSSYRRCVLPYDNFARLNALRQDLRRIERLTNQSIVPGVGDMARFIGGAAAPVFLRLVHFLQAQEGLDVRITYGGIRYGWEAGARKGSRPILSVTPLRRAFLVLCILGRKELEVIQEHGPALLTQQALQDIAATPQLHDGRWVQLRIADETGLPDALALFFVKHHGKSGPARFAALPPIE